MPERCFGHFLLVHISKCTISSWDKWPKMLPPSAISSSQYTEMRLRTGLRPSPHWGSLQCSPDTLAGFQGPLRGREGKGGKGGEGSVPTSFLQLNHWILHIWFCNWLVGWLMSSQNVFACLSVRKWWWILASESVSQSISQSVDDDVTVYCQWIT